MCPTWTAGRLARIFASVLTTWIVLIGCTPMPSPRLPAYLGLAPVKAEPLPVRPAEPLEVGLLVINDTMGERSAPALSEEFLDSLQNVVRDVMEKEFPIRVAKVIPTSGMHPSQDPQQLESLARDSGVRYLVFAIISSTEVEVPTRLPITGIIGGGGGRGDGALGYQAENYALVELAVFDAEQGQALVLADGRAWASLYRLAVPVESNAYPVVRRGQLYAPIYPTEDAAKDTLRWVSARDAIDQAVMHLGNAWAKPPAG